MNINQVGAELLEVLKQGLVSGSKLVSEQFPILCQQILRWGVWNNVFTIILSVVIMFTCYKLIRFVIKKQTDDEYGNVETWSPIVYILCGMVGIVFFIMFWTSIWEIGKIFSAPNVYLLDYFKSLITQK
jgi:uncharacterized membrane protein YuzA (DUF378 family)